MLRHWVWVGEERERERVVPELIVARFLGWVFIQVGGSRGAPPQKPVHQECFMFPFDVGNCFTLENLPAQEKCIRNNLPFFKWRLMSLLLLATSKQVDVQER